MRRRTLTFTLKKDTPFWVIKLLFNIVLSPLLVSVSISCLVTIFAEDSSVKLVQPCWRTQKKFIFINLKVRLFLYPCVLLLS